MSASSAAPNPPAVEVESLDLTEEGRRTLADVAWMHEELRLGRFAGYADEYVGVFEKQVVGHNASLRQLRADVERDRGIGPARLATTFVPGPKGIGGGGAWPA
jgi:hypothetical protein